MRPEDAAKELLRRRAARDGLIDFTRYTFHKYRPADHHFQIAEKLQAVEAGDIKRLMIFMPPRHGKSELASKRFPAWCLGRDADKNFISASYNSELASDFGREVRNIIKSPEYQTLFPGTTVAKDSGAADRWHTNGFGGYVAAGIGTAVTGRGAHIFTIDDPVKDREQAESETARRKIYEWYTSTAYTRLESDVKEDQPDWLWDVGGAVRDGLVKPFEGAVVLIQTRWHEDDLSGRLLEDMAKGADQWDILELPAIQENKALWPSKYPLDRLESIRTAIGPRDWSALYQQQPQPDEGTYFLKKWFNRYSSLPEFHNLYMTSDYAVSDDKGDYTEHTLWAVDSEENIYMVCNWYGQTPSDVWINEGLQLVKGYKPLCWFGEGGVIRKAIEPFLRRMMQEQKIFCRMEWINPVGDKAARARGFQARASAGKVYFPYGQEGDRCIDQLIRFPTGKDDDFVDTCSLLGMAIDHAHPAIVPPPNHDKGLQGPTFKDILRSNGKNRDYWS